MTVPPGVTLAIARPDQTAAVMALLPELLQAEALPTRFVVAHVAGDASQLLGAAAFEPVVHAARSPGFRACCRVLPPWRRQGLGRALMASLAEEARAWDMARLLSWQALPEGAESRFLQAQGWRVNFTLHGFVAPAATALPLCARIVDTLRAHGRVPPEFRLLPLAEVPLDAVVALHSREFNAEPAAARQALQQALAQPLLRQLSVALWDGRLLAGYLLAGTDGDMPEVRFWASQPGQRSGWPAAVLLHAYVQRAVDHGIHHARYHCHDSALAPLNVARKTGAVAEPLRHGWVVDLGPQA